MRAYFKDKKVLKNCKIYQMLSANARGRHISFHTPGHKKGAWDITELSFSDNLSSPNGCIAEAEKDIADVLGASKSYILTDGSTSGVLSLLYTAKGLGVNTLFILGQAHKSVLNGCRLLGITPLFENGVEEADGVFCTSPDYYGQIANLKELRAFCDRENKLLLIDGAHGGHLHFDKALYAGAYADLWVDGVHKSLPALTQGAVVSARTEALGLALREAVDVFRTTSPSYPIMASVEYAVKYPKNQALQAEVEAFIREEKRILKNGDWTKICALFGENSFAVEKELEKEGIYAEFCDGEVVMFYLSPATTKKDFARLKGKLKELFKTYPYAPNKETQRIPTPLVLEKNEETEWLEIDKSVGRVCAGNCGLFPPCTPLILSGERITEEKIALMKQADNVFGIFENKVLVFKTKE